MKNSDKKDCSKARKGLLVEVDDSYPAHMQIVGGINKRGRVGLDTTKCFFDEANWDLDILQEVADKFEVSTMQVKKAFRLHSLYIQHAMNTMNTRSPLYQQVTAYRVPNVGVFHVRLPTLVKDYIKEGVLDKKLDFKTAESSLRAAKKKGYYPRYVIEKAKNILRKMDKNATIKPQSSIYYKPEEASQVFRDRERNK